MLNFLQKTRYHSSWHSALTTGLSHMEAEYLKQLLHAPGWLPGIENIFNAFSLPRQEVKIILLGESPYPRPESANGYAFWDQAVGPLWSHRGFSTAVNRATSLRNFMKMLLLADQKIEYHAMLQHNIAALDHRAFLQTNAELFQKLLQHGCLLLNATLTLDNYTVRLSARYWRPLLQAIFQAVKKNPPTLLLLGKVAQQTVKNTCAATFPQIKAPHPYNLSFISQPDVIQLFRPLQLLKAT